MTNVEADDLTSLTPSIVASMDRRTEPRLNLSYLAFAFWGCGNQTSCEVTNLSASGAHIVFEPEADLPEKFGLHILATSAHFRAIVRWRNAQEFGVKFIHA